MSLTQKSLIVICQDLVSCMKEVSRINKNTVNASSDAALNQHLKAKLQREADRIDIAFDILSKSADEMLSIYKELTNYTHKTNNLGDNL